MGWGTGAPWMLGGSMAMILFWVLIIVGIVFLVKWIASESKPSSPADETPLDILRERYARGEINKAQYERMRKDVSD